MTGLEVTRPMFVIPAQAGIHQEILDKHADPWGIKVTNVESKHVDLPNEMQRAIAKQAADQEQVLTRHDGMAGRIFPAV